MIREILVAVAQASAPVTSREVAAAIGMDYEGNFNKREAKFERKLRGFVYTNTLSGVEVGRTLKHWCLEPKWKDFALDDILKAFDAAPSTPKSIRTRESIREQAEALATLAVVAGMNDRTFSVDFGVVMKAASIVDRKHAAAVVNELITMPPASGLDPNYADGAQHVVQHLIERFDLRF